MWYFFYPSLFQNFISITNQLKLLRIKSLQHLNYESKLFLLLLLKYIIILIVLISFNNKWFNFHNTISKFFCCVKFYVEDLLWCDVLLFQFNLILYKQNCVLAMWYFIDDFVEIL